jgi:hypothetical protein
MSITFILSKSNFMVVAGRQILTIVASSALMPFGIGGVLLVCLSLTNSREAALCKHRLFKAMFPRARGRMKTRDMCEWRTSWVFLLW